ncbi:MAG: hypothetical protein IPM48_02635 [Saprospiraceae bacterium]|nr:hypothetical protein [Saprospiraceae bacterium]
MNLKISLSHYILVFLYFLHLACKPESSNQFFHLKIRVKEEPDCLQPIVSQSSLATQIEILIMPPLFEYSPDQLELSPMLVKELKAPVQINDSVLAYDYEIFENATWDDGQPVIAKDVAFTIKSALNPHLRNGSWRGFFQNIYDVDIDLQNPKKFRAMVKSSYMLSREMTGNFCIYPAHVYDTGKVLEAFSIPELVIGDSSSMGKDRWVLLQNYARDFESEAYCKKIITGCGPYRLKSWETGKRIVLEKKSNWWGESLVKDFPLLSAEAHQIEYIVIPEEASAVIALKNGQIDLVSDVSARQFDELKSNPAFEVATPAVMQYYYLEINHRNIFLSRLEVRKALARLLDLDQFISTQMNGLASRIIGPVLPGKSYYHKELSPVAYSPQEAKNILTEAGWSDSNQDGTLDLEINGQRKELILQLSVTGNEIGKNLGILLQEEAKKIGIKIEVISKESAVFMKDRKNFQFELATMASRQSPSLWDPFQSWHTQQSNPGGFNVSGYGNTVTDSLIMAIRNAKDDIQRKKAYMDFQQILYDDQAHIFLFSPLEKIVYRKGLELIPTMRRPGYVENMIRNKE